MATLHNSPGGDYAYLPGKMPFSSGVIALPGYEIVRARFARHLPAAEGFEAIAAHLRDNGRPLTALCAAELRSPEPLSMDSFAAFNRQWADTLRRWGLVAQGPGGHAVARSNLCPLHAPPASPSFHAFCYTVPSQAAHAGLLTTSDHSGRAPGPRSFVLAGLPEWPEDTPFPDGIVARGDGSPEGLRRKAAFVLDALAERCALLGADWRTLTAVQIYTVHELGPLVASEFAPRGLLESGLLWHPSRPPVAELEFEADVRCVRRELVID